MSSRRSVLIVDDDPDVRQVLRAQCLAAKLDPECAASAEEAIALLKRGPFSIVVLDLIMPGGSGLEVLDFIEQHEAVKHVFIISSLAELWNARNEHAPNVSHLAKPFDPAELIRQIYDVLQITDMRS